MVYLFNFSAFNIYFWTDFLLIFRLDNVVDNLNFNSFLQKDIQKKHENILCVLNFANGRKIKRSDKMMIKNKAKSYLNFHSHWESQKTRVFT